MGNTVIFSGRQARLKKLYGAYMLFYSTLLKYETEQHHLISDFSPPQLHW